MGEFVGLLKWEGYTFRRYWHPMTQTDHEGKRAMQMKVGWTLTD